MGLRCRGAAVPWGRASTSQGQAALNKRGRFGVASGASPQPPRRDTVARKARKQTLKLSDASLGPKSASCLLGSALCSLTGDLEKI